MKLLVIGHPLIIDSNRKFWNVFAKQTSSEVDLICPKKWSSNLSSQLPFIPNPETDDKLNALFPVDVFFRGNGSLFFFNPLELFQLLRRRKYDAIFLNQETWALSTLTLILLKLLTRNAPTPLHLCVAQNIKKMKFRILHPYERFIARFITQFFYCSEEVKDVLRWKGITRPACYFPLPFDDESYRATKMKSSKTFRLGYLGRLSEDKGLPMLVAAVEELIAEGIELELVIGGRGPLQAELQKKSFVRYLGLILHNQSHLFYQQIDCFVLPSQTRPHWKEQFGRVIVEAFGSGRPVIGSSSGSIPEVLGKIEWPWIFEEKSVAELKNHIKNMRTHLQTQAGDHKLSHSVARNHQLFSQSQVSLRLFEQLKENL